MTSLPSRRHRETGLSGWLAGLANFFDMRNVARVRAAALTAACLVLVQAFVIATLLVRNGGPTYQGASGPSEIGGLPVFVAFSEEARAPAITQLLLEFHASIVDGPKPGGVYKIMLRDRDVSQHAQAAILDRLSERRDVVRVVLPGGD